MCREMFSLLALLELYAASYIDADAYFVSKNEQTTLGSQQTPPKDRLLGYLQLVNLIKKGKSSSSAAGKENESMPSYVTTSGGPARKSAKEMVTLLSKLNFSVENDLQKLKGIQVDDNFLTALSDHIDQIEKNHADKVF
jgi:hypothetical protein